MGLDEIKDVHFSGGRSLVEWCLGGYIDQIWFEDFVSNTIIERMLILCHWQMIQAAWECCCRAPAGCYPPLGVWMEAASRCAFDINSKLREAITESLNQQQGPVCSSRPSVVWQSASSRISQKPRVRKRQQMGKRPRFGRGRYPLGSWVCEIVEMWSTRTGLCAILPISHPAGSAVGSWLHREKLRSRQQQMHAAQLLGLSSGNMCNESLLKHSGILSPFIVKSKTTFAEEFLWLGRTYSCQHIFLSSSIIHTHLWRWRCKM